jgi:hypothetical protein
MGRDLRGGQGQAGQAGERHGRCGGKGAGFPQQGHDELRQTDESGLLEHSAAIGRP